MADKEAKKSLSAEEVLGKAKAKKPEAEKKDEKKSPSREKGKKKPVVKHKSTHIDHHDDGSHTVRHVPRGGGEDGKMPEEQSYAAVDTPALLSKLKAQLGGGEEEEAAEGEQPGAGAPAPAAAAQAASPKPMV